MDSEHISRKPTQLEFLDKRIDDSGLTARIVSTFEKHWGGRSLPLIHITNDEVNWGPHSPITSTGFVDSILQHGLKKFSNVGHIPSSSMQEEIDKRFSKKPSIDTQYISEEEARNSPINFLSALDRIRQEFIHHGLRTNKNKVNGKLSIPAVVIIDGDVKKQAGDDSPVHAQVNVDVRPEQIIGVFQFDPEEVIRNYMMSGSNPPHSEKLASKSAIPFRVELSGTGPSQRKEFTRKIIQSMGRFRIQELVALSEVALDLITKEQIILAAHDLVDIYVVSPSEFDEYFPKIPASIEGKILERRMKYSLVKDTLRLGR